VGQGEDETAIVELRTAGTAKNLMRRAGVDQFLFAERSLHQRSQHHRTSRQIDARRQRLGADGDRQQFLLEQILDDAAIFRQQSSVMHADAAPQHLLEFGTNSLGPIEFIHFVVEPSARAGREQIQALEHLGHAPTLIAVEAENQRRRRAVLALALGHVDQLIAEKFIADPAERQRHLAFLALDQFQFALMTALQPVEELAGISDRGG
jgi:hypothetical protein